jgi:hypothetical protein
MTAMTATTALLIMTLQATVPIRSIDKGLESQMDNARQATARSAAEWATLWNRHAGERARPPVDFSKEMVVAVFLGSRPTAGFSMEIVSAREEGFTLIVQYRETRPPQAGSVVAQILTSPYHIVAVPIHAAVKDVKFERIN